MTGITQYFKNIYETITTIFDGMSITFSYLFQKPITVQYPNRLKEPVQKQLPERYRGFLQVDHNICTSCEACAKACPIDCISLDGVKVSGRKGKAPYFFYIDLSKCMFCGLCIEPCPTDSIYFTREFEGSEADVEKLIFTYVPADVSKKYLAEGEKYKKEKQAKQLEAKEKNTEEKETK